ncbi:MAG: hypothetical protein EHM48_00835 [Planctomycetaceae bacterium]|nr:MAG: hypothetical protein EHM48_00835 [Planctomycetaceae bacterium]
MRSSPTLLQWIWVAAAIVLFVVAGLLLTPLDTQSQSLGLVPPGDVVSKEHPEMSLLTILPGGLRAPLITYYWIRSQNLMQDKRYFEARSLASIICALEPHSPGVWDFQAFNMAWNISVSTHTPAERWRWIYNGVTLLRDEGIPLNPRSPALYSKLGWIFFAKMGGELDEMHMTYKAHWASIMQHLLGAPPPGEFDVVVAAFEPLANPDLIDKNIPGRTDQLIQKERLDALLKSDPAVADYVRRLTDMDITLEPTSVSNARMGQTSRIYLLDAFNRWSLDDAAASVRRYPPTDENDRQLAQAKLINDPAYAQARNKLLTFVRAQRLWNEYKMDPAFMLDLMKRYKIPIDWRLPQAAGMYWMAYGIKACGTEYSEAMNDINTDRVVMSCLKDMTGYGKLTYIENPSDPDAPTIYMNPDQRLVMPTHERFLAFIVDTTRSANFQSMDSAFADGHRGYLLGAIESILVPAHRKQEAQKLYDYLKTAYKLKGNEWDNASVDDFVRQRMKTKDMTDPIRRIAGMQITISLQTAFVALAANQTQTYNEMYDFAKGVYDRFQADAVDRNKLAPFNEICASILAQLMVEPRELGYELALLPSPQNADRGDRQNLYSQLMTLHPELLAMIYDFISGNPDMVKQCEMRGIQFQKAFPPPPGLDAWRKEMEKRLNPTEK